MTALFFANTLVFFSLFMIWTKSSAIDFIIKIVLFFLFVWNGFTLLQILGFIIKI